MKRIMENTSETHRRKSPTKRKKTFKEEGRRIGKRKSRKKEAIREAKPLPFIKTLDGLDVLQVG